MHALLQSRYCRLQGRLYNVRQNYTLRGRVLLNFLYCILHFTHFLKHLIQPILSGEVILLKTSRQPTNHDLQLFDLQLIRPLRRLLQRKGIQPVLNLLELVHSKINYHYRPIQILVYVIITSLALILVCVMIIQTIPITYIIFKPNRQSRSFMRSSKLNMSTSKLSTKYLDEACIEHDGEPFVNFCAAMTCVKPLCAECIENHYSYHKNLRTPPEIISFKSLKNQCITKIGEILDRVGADQNDMSMNQLGEIFEQSIKKIRQTRDHCRKIMDSYFHNLEDYVRKRMQKMLSDQSDLFRELDKVTTIVSELKMLCNRLQNPKSFISNAQTIIKLDGDKIEQKVKQGFNTVNSLRQQHRVNLQIEKNYEQKLVNFLSKTVYYGNYENMETMPKVAQQLITQSHWDNMSKSRSKSRQKLGQSNFNSVNEQPSANTLYKSGANTSIHRQRQRQKSVDRDDDRRSSMTRKSSSKSIKGGKKQILGMNSFKESAERKFLHFFQNDENILHYLDLEDSQSFQAINVNINFKIPDFHKSIATPNGDLYLIGGNLADNGIKSQKIYKYDFISNSLIYCASLKYGRSSHSVCFNNKYIYVMGGFLNQQEITNRCERFDISTNKVEQIRPMNYEACSFACCSFNGRYIFKFGGIGENNEITHYIEMYDEKTGEWEVINPSIELVKGQNLMRLSTSAAIQITNTEIMVMGGYDVNNIGHKQTYIFKIDQNGQAIIKDINTYALPFAQGFWNNIPILHKKHVFVLQNISYNNDECSESERRILIFDGVGWKVVN